MDRWFWTSFSPSLPVKRLHEALDTGKAAIHTFQYIALGRAHEPISDDDLANLLKKILSKEDALGVVFEILTMRFHGPKEEFREYSGSLMAVARDGLAMYSFSNRRARTHGLGYGMTRIARICLNGEEGKNAAEQMCRHLTEAITEHRANAYDWHELLGVISHLQPFVLLNAFLGNEGIKDYQLKRAFSGAFGHANPLNQITDDDLFSWCDDDPFIRYPQIASVIQAALETEKTGELEWNPTLLSVIGRAPELGSVLERLNDALRPTIWSGSLVDLLQNRSVLLSKLFRHENAEVRAWAKSQHSALQEDIGREREMEKRSHRERRNSFE